MPPACTATPSTSAPTSTGPSSVGVLARYARWHVVGRAKTDRHGHLSAGVAGRCRSDIQTAKAFIDHLAAHGHDLA